MTKEDSEIKIGFKQPPQKSMGRLTVEWIDPKTGEVVKRQVIEAEMTRKEVEKKS